MFDGDLKELVYEITRLIIVGECTTITITAISATALQLQPQCRQILANSIKSQIFNLTQKKHRTTKTF